MEYIKRPKSVSVIASLFFAEGFLWLMVVIPGLLDPSNFLVIWLAFIGLFEVVSGIALLNGFSWGRSMILRFAPFVIVLQIAFFGFNPLLLGYIFGYLIILLFLMQSNALKYFRSDLSEYSMFQKHYLSTG